MWRAPVIVLSALALLLTAGAARAEDEQALSPEQSRRRSAQILAYMDQPEAEESWLDHHLARIHLHGKTGFAYVHPLRLAEHDLKLSLRGPALGKKRVGLSLEIRF
jgi:hypothetical protein